MSQAGQAAQGSVTSGTGATSGAASGNPVDKNQIRGISPSTPIGSCFFTSDTMPIDGQPHPLNLHRVACDNDHQFQLISVNQAQGSPLTYPATTY